MRLPSGGSIVIESTGSDRDRYHSARATRGGDIEETAFNTNPKRLTKLRQLRRDLGGLIVIDFIDMTPVRHQRAVENRLREAVRQDRARIQISHIFALRLLEMSRQPESVAGRVQPPRLPALLGTAPCVITNRCRSVLRLIEEEALKENTKEVHAIVPVPIASYLLNENVPQ